MAVPTIARDVRPRSVSAAKAKSKASLNHDVLCYIVSYLEQRELLNVMETCHAFHSAALKPLVQRISLWPMGTRALQSFCEFLLADPAGRAVHVREIRLFLNSVSNLRSVLPTIIRALALCTNAEALTMSVTDQNLQLYPDLFTAVTSLRKLKTVSLTVYGGPRAAGLIAAMPSTLTSLEFSFDEDWSDAARLFEHQSRTLETLHVRGAHFVDRPTAQFEALRELSLRFGEASYDVALLKWLFPNVTHLHLEEESFLTWEDADVREDAAQAHRKRNLEAQEKASWTSLKSVKGELRSIWAAAFGCTVDSLATRVESCHAKRLADVLHDMQPRELDLEVPMYGWEAGEFHALLHAAKDLTSLRLRLELDQDSGVKPDDIMLHTVKLLGHLPLTTLDLSLVIAEDHYDYDEGHPTAESLSDLNIESYVRQLAENIKTLRKASLRVDVNSNSEWNIRRSASGKSLLERAMWENRLGESYVEEEETDDEYEDC
ncbi:hypothetical protein CERSUDRAFT_85112 [Gelatoporia subvermispora B]|uniref:F-box domain-containing protein n=1 Tax=Ceriporiopsis subvermispora (strain B) TaxID=914234 RepID=M2PIK9_CERS8|nr:hypothetical protein CERSUDRAFT_85112 [Gelatoporia subvermispora B]